MTASGLSASRRVQGGEEGLKDVVNGREFMRPIVEGSVAEDNNRRRHRPISRLATFDPVHRPSRPCVARREDRARREAAR